MNLLAHIGRFSLLIGKAFSKPERWSIYRRQLIREMASLGVQSMGITTIISVFMGAVITIQTASNMDGSWIPTYAIGFTVRQSVILEFSTTILALILAGKIGSSIASELGTMRVTEQIDALEIMGINSASFLILPKIFALIVMMPFLVVFSMILGISGGLLFGRITGAIEMNTFVYGLQYDFDSFSITYALVKSLFFAFAIASIPAYYGYNVKGGARDVAQASTNSVVATSISILGLNFLLTELLLG